MLACATRAQAQNRGVYPLGMSATGSGALPAARFTYANQLLYYARDEAKDDVGATLPQSGTQAVLMDMNTLTWVSDFRIAGARYAAAVTLPIARNKLSSDLAGEISSGSGFADSYYMPIMLGWGQGKTRVKAIYGFLAPTGKFEAGGSDNVGSGYWTHAFSSGQTFALGSEGRLAVSAFEMLELHTEQVGTGIRPGDTFDLDGSVVWSFPGGESVRPRAGVVGYFARQTSARTGPSLAPAEIESRYAVNALGVTVGAEFPKPRASLTFKGFKEFSNRSTYQGASLQLLGTIAL